MAIPTSFTSYCDNYFVGRMKYPAISAHCLNAHFLLASFSLPFYQQQNIAILSEMFLFIAILIGDAPLRLLPRYLRDIEINT